MLFLGGCGECYGPCDDCGMLRGNDEHDDEMADAASEYLKTLRGGKMIDFDLAIFKAAELVKQNLIDNKREIEDGFNGLGENFALKVSMPLKFSTVDNGIKIEAGISFIESQIKNKIAAVVSDQEELPLEGDAD